MHRIAILAGAAAVILSLLGYPATAAVRQSGLLYSLNRHADLAIQPVVVMFNLAMVRHHMLDTLTELIRSPVLSRSPPANCAAHPGSAPVSAGSRLSRDPPARC